MTTDRDDDLEAFLQRRSPLHQRFAEPDRLEPPPELDRIVLSRAREAIHAPEPETVFRPARWALPFSLAAVLVLSFAVVLSFRLAQPESADAHYVARAVPTRTAPQPASRPAAPDAAAERETAAGSAPGTEESTSEPIQPQGPAQTRLAARHDPAKRSQDVLSAGADHEEAVPVEAPLAQPGDQSKDAAAESDVVLAMNRRADSSAPQAGSDDQVIRPRSMGEQATAVESPAPGLAAARTEISEVMVAGASVPTPLRKASSWLRQIDRLRAAGRSADADREWQAFCEAYPDHPRVRAAREAAAAERPVEPEQPPPAEQPPPEPTP